MFDLQPIWDKYLKLLKSDDLIGVTNTDKSKLYIKDNKIILTIYFFDDTSLNYEKHLALHDLEYKNKPIIFDLICASMFQDSFEHLIEKKKEYEIFCFYQDLNSTIKEKIIFKQPQGVKL